MINNISLYHRKLIAIDEVCQFMSLVKDDDICYDKPNYTTKDYDIKHYVRVLLDSIPDWITLFEFQCSVWREVNFLNPKCIEKWERSSKWKKL